MSKQIQEAYIVAATRTPVAKRNGLFRHVRPDDLLAHALGDRGARGGDDVGFLNLFAHDLFSRAQLRRGLPVSSMCRMRAWVSGFFSRSTKRRRSTPSSQASSTLLPPSISPPHRATAAARATW